jgi:hypothetical protein
VSLRGNSRTGTMTGVLRTTFTNPITGLEESDPHGLVAVERGRKDRVSFGAGGGQLQTLCDLP